MARPIWKGHITFGLVNVPVELYSAETSRELKLHMLDRRDQARIHYERINENTGEPVPWEEIVKGYKYGEGDYVILTDEDFQKAAVEATKTIEIEQFVEAETIKPAFFEQPYFLAATKGSEKGYVLLREAMAETGRVGIARVVIHNRQHLAAMLVQGDALELIIMRFADELRDGSELAIPTGEPAKYHVNSKEVALAKQLIESMTGKFQPEKYHDEYREALMKWIHKRIEAGGKELPAEEPERHEEPARIINMMELLKRSVAGNKGRKSGRAPAVSHRRPALRRKGA